MEIQRSTGQQVAFVTADNGTGKFGSQWQTWLRELAIVFNIARSIIYHGNMPWRTFWCIYVEHANYLRNRTPTTALPYGSEGSLPSKAITPITAYTSDRVHLNNLKAFGCAAFPMRLHQPQGPSKLEPKIQGEENYIFIGMQGNSIYKLMHRKTLKVIVSADCKFIEHLFKGVEPEKPYSNYEIYKDNTHGVQTPLQIQTKKRKAIEAESVITDKNNSKMQCKSSTEAMSKSSPEVFEKTVMNRTHLNVRC
ncbi:hypothetical protein K3495_g13437 [Podosphaera aphanis]|nr:hypothetical protein K3495_g13437 [Podosphaera aphanis]